MIPFTGRSAVALTMAIFFIVLTLTVLGLAAIAVFASPAQAHPNIHCAHYTKIHKHAPNKRVVSAYKGHAGRAAGGGYIHKVRVTWQTRITGGYWVNTSAATYLRTCAT